MKSKVVGRAAEPGWKDFTRQHKGAYTLSHAAANLIAANPERQVVAAHGLAFERVDLTSYPTDLEKVVKLLQTVRNNLFHGGKHGAGAWDDPVRTSNLVKLGVQVLDELATLGQFEADYARDY